MAEEAGWIFSNDADTWLGFSLDLETLPLGYNNLTILDFSFNNLDSICLNGDFSINTSAIYNYSYIFEEYCIQILQGCTNIHAHNYNPEAIFDDGSCILGPTILSIYDVPEDNGGYVFINWESINIDSLPNNEINQYSIWRYIPNQNVGENNNLQNRGWEFLDYIDAYAFEDYSYTAPTIITSNVLDSLLIPQYTQFKILAHTDDQNVFYPSLVDSGYSIDNIMPSSPQNFLIEFFEEYNMLSWSNSSEDISHFDIYRNNQYLATTIDSVYLDYDIRSTDFSYTLQAWDINGNVNEIGSTSAISTNSLSYGNNLIGFKGFPSTTNTQTLLEELGDVKFILGQGVGLFNTSDGWSGNLNVIDPTKGFWLNIEANRDWTLQYPEGFLDPCSQVHLTFGNNLLSYQGNTAPTIDALGGEELAQHFNFILGQGVGLFNTSTGWSGNLNNLESKNGYWLNVTSDYPWYVQGEGTPFRWNINHGCEEPVIDLTKEIVDPFEAIPNEFQFVQSTEQAFYLIEELLVDNQYPQIGDIIIAFNQGVLVGSAEYTGRFTALPVMGRDLSEQTLGFIEYGQIPELKLYKISTGEIIDLKADLEPFSNLLVSEVQTVSGSTVIIPTDYALHPAYPNPFNPVTTISFGLPSDTQITLNVYDVEGRKITTLTDGIRSAGTHSIEWNAESYPSGVYFVKLDAGEFTQTQKLMLVK